MDAVDFSFESTVIYWRGPAPWFYAPIPTGCIDVLRPLARAASYGWGCVPVGARIADVVFRTSLFPKDDTYLLPLKAAIRRKTNITAGDRVSVVMTVRTDSAKAALARL